MQFFFIISHFVQWLIEGENLQGASAMRLVLLRSRDNIIGRPKNKRDFGEIWKDEEMEWGMNDIITR